MSISSSLIDPVHSAALVSEHFKTPHKIAETLLFPLEIKAGETITSDYIKGLKHFMKVIPGLPWGSGLIYGGLDRQVRSDVRIYPV